MFTQYLSPPIAAGILCILFLFPINSHGQYISERTGGRLWDAVYNITTIILVALAIIFPIYGLFAPWSAVDSFLDGVILNFLVRIIFITTLILIALLLSPIILPLPVSVIIGIGVSVGKSWRESQLLPKLRNILSNIAIVTVRFVTSTVVNTFKEDPNGIDHERLIERVNSFVDRAERSKHKTGITNQVNLYGSGILFVSIFMYFILESLATKTFLTYSIFHSITQIQNFVGLACLWLFLAGFFADPAYPEVQNQTISGKKKNNKRSSRTGSEDISYTTNDYGEIIEEKN